MDDQLRELERTARTRGARADIVTWLQGLLRAGPPPERAALLAWLAVEEEREPGKLAEELVALGREPLVRGIMALGAGLAWRWEATRPDDQRPALALVAAAAWLACPCERHAEAAGEAGEQALAAAEEARDDAVHQAVSHHHDPDCEPYDEPGLDDLAEWHEAEGRRVAVEEASDEELWGEVRQRIERGEGLDEQLFDEARERVDCEEGIAEELSEPEAEDASGPDAELEAALGRTDPSLPQEVTTLDKRVLVVAQVDLVARLAGLAARACAGVTEEVASELVEALGHAADGRAESGDSYWDDDYGDGVDRVVRSPALATPLALQTALLDALRRWALGLPPLDLPSSELAAPAPAPPSAAQPSPASRRRRSLEELAAGELELLAWTDHPEARRRTGLAVPRALVEWARGLSRFGPSVCARAALAAAERASLHWSLEWDDRPAQALAATREWLACPCEAHAAALRAALDRAVDAMTDASGRAAGAAESAALAAEVALTPSSRLPQACAEALGAATRVVPAAGVRAAVAAALREWVLSG